MFVIQEKSTEINVRKYWPSVVASGAMLLATDELSKERTLGSYMLSACDHPKYHLVQFAHLHIKSVLLLNTATTYDAYAAQLLKQHIFDTWVQDNVTALREMMYDEGFADKCNNLTQSQRKKLIVKWGDDTAVYILTIDALRGSFVIKSILQVNSLIIS